MERCPSVIVNGAALRQFTTARPVRCDGDIRRASVNATSMFAARMTRGERQWVNRLSG
jgi:hypothetical protein